MITQGQFAYLVEIGISQPIIDRISLLMKTYESMFLEKGHEIYISEYKNETNERVYESIWLISEKYIYEMKEFIGKEILDITPYCHSIKYVLFEKSNYEIAKSNENSKLLLKFFTDDNTKGELKSTGRNCDYLIALYEKFIKPNIG